MERHKRFYFSIMKIKKSFLTRKFLLFWIERRSKREMVNLFSLKKLIFSSEGKTSTNLKKFNKLFKEWLQSYKNIKSEMKLCKVVVNYFYLNLLIWIRSVYYNEIETCYKLYLFIHVFKISIYTYINLSIVFSFLYPELLHVCKLRVHNISFRITTVHEIVMVISFKKFSYRQTQ